MRSIFSAVVVLALTCPIPSHAQWTGGWARTIDGNAGFVSTTAADAEGYIYIGGGFLGTISIAGGPSLTSSGMDFSAFLAKLSPGGAHLWSVASEGDGGDYIEDIAINSLGAIAVCGNSSSSEFTFGTGAVTTAGDNDGFVALFSSDGIAQFVRLHGGAEDDRSYSVAFLSDTTFSVAGLFEGSFDMYGTPVSSNGESDIFVVTHTTTGGTTAVTTYGSAGVETRPLIDVTPGGTFYLSATFTSAMDIGPISLVGAANRNIFVARFPAPGAAPEWAHEFGGSGDGGVWAYDMAVDADDNAFVSGFSFSEFPFAAGTVAYAGGRDGFVVAYKGNGSEAWGTSFGGPGEDNARSLAVDGNALYVTGHFTGTADFGPFTETTSGLTNACFLTLSRFGVWESVLGVGGVDNSYGFSVAVGNAPITAGAFSDDIQFGSLDVIHPGDGQLHGYVVSLRDPAVGVVDAPPASPNLVGPATPNPFRAFTQVEVAVGTGFAPLHATVHDVAGRLVRTLKPRGENAVGWDGVTDRGVRAEPGVYVLSVSDGTQTYQRRVTLVP